jgi:sugar phosphate isomerase/epimerase
MAIHGPFLGMDYAHIDHLIRDAVQRRLDMTFDAAVNLKADRVVLHSSHKPEIDLFNLNDAWLKGSVAFWRGEIQRWAQSGIQVVLENELEKVPDLLIDLVDEIDSPHLGLCLDIGHQHAFSDLDAVEWVRRMDTRLYHVHLHDNDRTGDHHWRIGRGTIDFESFYEAIRHRIPGATISLEIEDTMETMMHDLRNLAARFAANRTR